MIGAIEERLVAHRLDYRSRFPRLSFLTALPLESNLRFGPGGCSCLTCRR